jgi:PST family polysaccharide transporter
MTTVSAAVAPVAEGPDAAADFGPVVRSALKWSFAGTFFLRFGTFLSGLIMARLLSPHDFGLYSVATVALLLTTTINDIGIEPTLIRWPGEIDELAPTAVTVVMVTSALLFLGFWVSAPAFASAFGAPGGAGIIRLMSVGLLINGAFLINSVVITRTFRQKVRAWADGAGIAVMIGVSLLLATAGVGAYSLAWGTLLGNVTVGCIIFVCSGQRYRPRFHCPTAKLLMRQGAPLAGAGLIVVAILNTDYLVVGGTLGAVSLGFYQLAWNMANWPVTLFSGAVTKVSLPAFARLQRDQRALDRAFSRSMGAAMGITVLFCVLLSALSLPAVRVVYGHKWALASGALVSLAILAVIRVTTLLATDALVAKGHGRATFGLQALWLTALVPALVVGGRLDGIRGVAVAHVLVATFVALPTFLFVLRRRGFSMRSLARSVARPVAAGASAAAVAIAATHLLTRDLLRLGVGGAFAVGVYLFVMRPLWAPLVSARRPRLHSARI